MRVSWRARAKGHKVWWHWSWKKGKGNQWIILEMEKGPSKYFFCLPPAGRAVTEQCHGLAVYKLCFQPTNELVLIWSLPLLLHEHRTLFAAVGNDTEWQCLSSPFSSSLMENKRADKTAQKPSRHMEHPKNIWFPSSAANYRHNGCVLNKKRSVWLHSCRNANTEPLSAVWIKKGTARKQNFPKNTEIMVINS